MSTSDSAGAAAPLKRWRWYELFIVIILVAVAAISWSRRLIGPIDLRYDASTYYILGTSLAEGKGYRLLNEPGEIEATQYPPLFPIMVAAHQWILGPRRNRNWSRAEDHTFSPHLHRLHPRGLCSVKTISADALRFFRRANYDFKSLHLLDVEPARARDPVRPYHNSLLPFNELNRRPPNSASLSYSPLRPTPYEPSAWQCCGLDWRGAI